MDEVTFDDRINHALLCVAFFAIIWLNIHPNGVLVLRHSEVPSRPRRSGNGLRITPRSLGQRVDTDGQSIAEMPKKVIMNVDVLRGELPSVFLQQVIHASGVELRDYGIGEVVDHPLGRPSRVDPMSVG